MNKAIIMGNLTRDPEIRTTTNQVPVTSFALAVERRFKDQSGQRQADFINIVAWRQQAEFVAKHFQKGSRMIVLGSIQTRSYEDKDGIKRTATDIVADEIYFGSSKASSGSAPSEEPIYPFNSPETSSLPFDL